MIHGHFDEENQPVLTIQLSGPDETIEVTLVVDTGFSSDICVPILVAIALKLPLKFYDFIELADGSVNRELFFQGECKLGELPSREVDIYLTESEQGLIGAGMFKGMRLTIDYEQQTVTLEPSR